MLQDTPAAAPPPLLAFPELDATFAQLPAEAADAVLTACLARLQALPVDPAAPAWPARLGQSLRALLVAAEGHGPEVLDTLALRLAHWTLNALLAHDALATEVLVALARQQARALAVAGHEIVRRLVQAPPKAHGVTHSPPGAQPPPLPAWTATLIGLLRQAASHPGAATTARAALAALPDGPTVLRPQAFAEALARREPQALRALVGQFSLLSLIDLAQVPSQPLLSLLPPDGPAPTVAPHQQAAVARCLADATARLHWLLTPQGTRAIDTLLAQIASVFPAPQAEHLHRELVLSLARHAAIQQPALQGPEAALLVCQLQHLVQRPPGFPAPATANAWAPLWAAVRPLAAWAQNGPGLGACATDRSRTVNTLLHPRGLAGRLEPVAWRLALLRHSGLALADCLDQLVQQVPSGPNGQPLLARVLQTACASPPEHAQALLAMAQAQGLPPPACATPYTRHLLRAARGAPPSTSEDEATLRRVASELPPGLLALGLLGHVHLELPGLRLSPEGATWLVQWVQASVAALPASVPMAWVLQVCTPLGDALADALAPGALRQWQAWVQTL